MRDVARETYAGSLRLKLYQRRGAGGTGPRVLVLDAETSSAVLEVGGVPWEGAASDGNDNGAPSWVGESEVGRRTQAKSPSAPHPHRPPPHHHHHHAQPHFHVSIGR